MLLLYDHPLSPYAQKCRIALREKGLDFEARLPRAIGSGTGMEPAFVEASPRAEVPALVDGDVRVFDSTIILEYVEERWPTPRLLPASPAERARVRMLEDAMDTHYEPINWGLGEIHFFRRATGELAKRLGERAAEQAASWRRWLESQLGESPWFNGASFGWGDLAVAPYLNGSRGFGIEPARGSRLADWLERATARPSVAATAAEAAAFLRGAAGGGMGEVADLVAKGQFRREYRDHRLEWMVRSGGISVVLEGLERGNIRFVRDFDA
ncbi:MAG TPA: glutathione S-transferase family protein [Myxococcota bacterium]|nr:glutathione S-transferase family protein [Myxococcota bacterium]